MVDLAVYGGGGLGREIAVLINDINREKKKFNVIGFFDDGLKKGKSIDGLEVLGGLKSLNGWKKKLNVAMSVADPTLRQRLVQSIKNTNIGFPGLMHPSSIMGLRNKIGDGVIVTANVVMTTGISLHEFVIINLASTIGHDVTIGKFSSLMPACSISGNVKIGEKCLIGTGARILQNLSLGNGCIVGAGAVVTKNFSTGSTVMGVPAVKS